MNDTDPTDPDKNGIPPSEREALANLIHALGDTKKADDQQSRAQTRAANWTAFATVMIAVFTAATIGVGLAQWHVLTDTVNEMRDEQRPWLKATPKIVGPLYSKGGMLSASIEIDVGNSGRTPASGVKGAAMITGSGHPIVTSDDIREVCDRSANFILDRDSAADLVFPDGVGSVIVDAIDQGPVGDPPAKLVVLGVETALIYCVSYLNAGIGPLRHTGGAFVIGGVKSGSILRDGEMINPPELRLERGPFDLKWRSYAD